MESGLVIEEAKLTIHDIIFRMKNLILESAITFLVVIDPLAVAATFATFVAKVKVETLYADTVNRTLQLYGRTEPYKVARVSARQEGEVIEILVKEGQFVEQGKVILKLDKSDLEQQITAAKASLAQSEVEYQGAVKLKQKGLNDQSALARAKASLEQAKANLANLKLSLARTEIRAPFSGMIFHLATKSG